MRIQSIYMKDPYGVEVGEEFETVQTIFRSDDGVFVSVDFFTLVDGVRPEWPQNNRTFTWEGIELLSDDEILSQLIILVPELK
jgi:hypothetical protein